MNKRKGHEDHKEQTSSSSISPDSRSPSPSDRECPVTPKTNGVRSSYSSPMKTPKTILLSICEGSSIDQECIHCHCIDTEVSTDLTQQNTVTEEVLEKQLELVFNRLKELLQKPPTIIEQMVSNVQHEFDKQEETRMELKKFIEQKNRREKQLEEELNSVYDMIRNTEKLMNDVDAKIKRHNEQIENIIRETVSNQDTSREIIREEKNASWYLIVMLTVIFTVCIVTVISNYSTRRNSFTFPPS